MDKTEEISKKIIEMGKKDQEVRMIEPTDFDLMKKVDDENVKGFKKIFEQVGYISSKYGKDAQSGAFYLVQHMEVDELEFMKAYLNEMEKDMDGVDVEHYAMLVDRILTYEEKEQLYGTQFMPVDPKGDQSVLKLMPLSDPKNVDKRRLKLGLDTLDEFTQWLENDAHVTVVS